MYIIIKSSNDIIKDAKGNPSETINKRETVEGNFPTDYLEKRLNNGEDIIVISVYSKTIKVPYQYEDNGITLWEWKEYSYNY